MGSTLLLPGEDATHPLGEGLASLLRPGDVLALAGDLGAGKTTLTYSLARALGVPKDVPVGSPTFTLVRSYPAPIPLHHLDLYRLSSPRELDELGFDDLLVSGGIVVVEWADRFPEVFPDGALWLRLSWVDADHRKATFGPAPLDPRIAALIDAWGAP